MRSGHHSSSSGAIIEQPIYDIPKRQREEEGEHSLIHPRGPIYDIPKPQQQEEGDSSLIHPREPIYDVPKPQQPEEEGDDELVTSMIDMSIN